MAENESHLRPHIQAFFDELERLGYEEERNLKADFLEGAVSKFQRAS